MAAIVSPANARSLGGGTNSGAPGAGNRGGLSSSTSPSLDANAIPPSPEGEDVDQDTFQQILELDEDDGREFSKGMVYDYFTQAEKTFDDMDYALGRSSLNELSSLGHFLKGSSAAIGLTKVQATCELIQHYGHRRDEQSGSDLPDNIALKKIELLIPRVKDEYKAAKVWLEEFFVED